MGRGGDLESNWNEKLNFWILREKMAREGGDNRQKAETPNNQPEIQNKNGNRNKANVAELCGLSAKSSQADIQLGMWEVPSGFATADMVKKKNPKKMSTFEQRNFNIEKRVFEGRFRELLRDSMFSWNSSV